MKQQVYIFLSLPFADTPVKAVLLPFMSFVRFNFRWVLDFLIHPCMLSVSIFFLSHLIRFHLVCFIFMFEFSQKLLIHPCVHPDTFA